MGRTRKALELSSPHMETVADGPTGRPEHEPPASMPAQSSHDQPTSQLSAAEDDGNAPLHETGV